MTIGARLARIEKALIPPACITLWFFGPDGDLVEMPTEFPTFEALVRASFLPVESNP